MGFQLRRCGISRAEIFPALVSPAVRLPQLLVQPKQLHRFHLVRAEKWDTRDRRTSHSVTSTARVGMGTQIVEPRVMRGLCLQESGVAPKLRTDLDVPTPAPREALIEVLRAGICGTDLQMIDNYKPGFKGVLGHEFVGIVRKLGAHYTNDELAQQTWIGKRVVGEINVPCNASECATCARCSHEPTQGCPPLTRAEVMRRNHCPNRSCLGIVQKDGAFAEFITLPLANLYEVPDSVVDSHAVFAEPLAAACRILEQHLIQPSDHVVVLGDGKLGLMVVEILHATKAAKSVTLVGKHREKLALATQFVQNVHTLEEESAGDPEMTAFAARIVKDRDPFDVCIESSGSPTGMSLALKLVRERGTVVVKTTCSAKETVVDTRVVQSKGLRFVGSRCGPMLWAIRLLRDRKVDVQKYIHGVYPLEQAEAALAHAARRGALKIQFILH